ncbi:FtsX-like permease family protein [Luteimicrobium sp. DT211]|uniref:FtsX-like permease family protein n=1 Tax=Luteimicrobium sp. DT211 TaxID=3393412 RepID=UPI003CEF8719
MTGLWGVAAAGVRAHRVAAAGTALVLVLAGALLGATGVLAESGLRAGGADPTRGGGVVTLAGSFGGSACGIVVVAVATTVSLALRARRRELALVRTVGATRAQVRGLVAREAVLVALVAAPLGALAGLPAARVLRGLVVDAGLAPPDFEVALSPLPVVAATVLVTGTALVAGLVGAREVLRDAPTAAVGASAAEPATLGHGRRVTAWVLAAAGVLAAFSPVAFPGTVGSTAAASSVLLLVGATAVGGPAVVGALFGARGTRGSRGDSRRAPALPGPPVRGVGRWLAVASARGFARRLTLVVVPLALVVAFGTVQTATDRAAARASAAQLVAGLHVDLVAQVPAGATPAAADALVARVAALPGVRGAAVESGTTVAVRSDDDADLGPLAWETAGVRAFQAPAFDGLVDPRVTSGSLRALAAPGTVAVSRDAVLGDGTGVGDPLVVRFAGGQEARLRVVAVYERGLGFGDYLMGESTVRAHGHPVAGDVLVRAAAGRVGAVERELGALGLAAEAPSSYVATHAGTGEAERRLSELSLLSLLAFVVVAALDALVLTTLQRRDEVVLLRRTGATRRQLVSASCWEALLVAGAAGVVGTLVAAPAVLGAGYGLLGSVVPVADWRTWAALVGASAVVAFAGTVPATLRNAAGRTAR